MRVRTIVLAALAAVLSFLLAPTAQAACTITKSWETGNTWLAECLDGSKVYCIRSTTTVDGAFALDPADPSACTPIGPQAVAQPAASEPVIRTSLSVPSNYVGTVTAFRPSALMARCSQCVELRTFGKTVLVQVDEQPVPVLYGQGISIRPVTVDRNGTIVVESAAVATAGNLFIMGSMGGSIVSWTILEEDMSRPGVFVPTECRHVHTTPGRHDHPARLSVNDGHLCGY